MGVPTSEELRPQSGGETTKSLRDMWWHWKRKKERRKERIENVLPDVYIITVKKGKIYPIAGEVEV
jgi:hypothetical protein